MNILKKAALSLTVVGTIISSFSFTSETKASIHASHMEKFDMNRFGISLEQRTDTDLYTYADVTYGKKNFGTNDITAGLAMSNIEGRIGNIYPMSSDNHKLIFYTGLSYYYYKINAKNIAEDTASTKLSIFGLPLGMINEFKLDYNLTISINTSIILPVFGTLSSIEGSVIEKDSGLINPIYSLYFVEVPLTYSITDKLDIYLKGIYSGFIKQSELGSLTGQIGVSYKI
jgi:hypothetical protein